jgi:hypothetical protein
LVKRLPVGQFAGIGKRGMMPYLNITKLGTAAWNQAFGCRGTDDHIPPRDGARLTWKRRDTTANEAFTIIELVLIVPAVPKICAITRVSVAHREPALASYELVNIDSFVTVVGLPSRSFGRFSYFFGIPLVPLDASLVSSGTSPDASDVRDCETPLSSD